MKMFSIGLLSAALLGSLAQAKRGRTFETDAYLTNKRTDHEDPYLSQNLLLNMHQVEDYVEEDGGIGHEILEHIVGKDASAESHIVTTSDIDNYYNL